MDKRSAAAGRELGSSSQLLAQAALAFLIPDRRVKRVLLSRR
ncbi:hypothetical protein BH20VER1_BH20VER1_04820 [soil metagenome]